MNKAYFTVEGSAENLDEIKSIFERAGNKVIAMGAENKSLYHCGAVVVSNLVNGLFQVGAEMLVKCGFDKKDAKKALVPLFTGNADTLAEKELRLPSQVLLSEMICRLSQNTLKLLRQHG